MARILIGNVKHPLVNNGLTTEVGKYALDAAYGKTLTDKDTELENAITQLNSDIQYGTIDIQNGKGTIPFPHAFSSIPSISLVTKGISESETSCCKLNSISKTGAEVIVFKIDSSGISLPNHAITVTWIAIGK